MYAKAKLRSFKLSLFLIILFPGWQILSAQQTYEFPYQNPALTFGARVNDLVGRMTIDEKNKRVIKPGNFEFTVGGGQPNAKTGVKEANILKAGITLLP